MAPDKSFPQAARHVGVSRKTFRRRYDEGTGPVAYRIGGRIRFKTTDLDAWVEAQREIPRGASTVRPIGRAATILGGAA